jgi:hypothetical protein
VKLFVPPPWLLNGVVAAALFLDAIFPVTILYVEPESAIT